MPPRLLCLLLYLLLASCMRQVTCRPTDNNPPAGYGSWGTYKGIGGSASLAASGSYGGNVGLGVHTGPGGQYFLNAVAGKQAAFSGNGALNLGGYTGGFRYQPGFPNPGMPNPGLPNANFGFPSFNNGMG